MEHWKEVNGYEGIYEVSDCGRVRSLYHKNRPRLILKPWCGPNNYPVVRLTKNGTHKSHKIHRILMAAFVPNSENKEQVNHINGIKDDNRLDNLEWCTRSENIKHAYRTGLNHTHDQNGETNPMNKYDLDTVLLIRKCFDSGQKVIDISRELNIRYGTVSDIANRRRWKHLPEGAKLELRGSNGLT